MVPLLIVLVIVGTLIVLATRLSLYLYKSGALGTSHIRRLRRLHPVAVGPVSNEIPAEEALYSTSRRARIGLLLLVLVLVIGIVAIVMISMISAIFS